MKWDGTEKITCFCGKPAVVTLREGKPFLICFAHSYESGLILEIPENRPDDWENLKPEDVWNFLRQAKINSLNPTMERDPVIIQYRNASFQLHDRDADEEMLDAAEKLEDDALARMSEEQREYIRQQRGPFHPSMLEEARKR
jgi:hypothetical protein